MTVAFSDAILSVAYTSSLVSDNISLCVVCIKNNHNCTSRNEDSHYRNSFASV